jgi:3-phenylpropionate/trans-cinnamate dioxygenase ferredoxin subunit
MSTSTLVRLVGAAKQPCGTAKRFDVNGGSICIAHVESGRFLAVDDACTHEDQSLSEGWLTGCEIECPRHNAIFSLETGEALSLPATEPLKTYPVQVSGDDLLIDSKSSDPQ